MLSNILISCLMGATLNINSKLVDPSAVKVPISISIAEIDEASAARFSDAMDAAQTTGQTIVPVYISSYGGSVYAILQIIDAVKRSKIPVATIAEGKAMSAGAVLLAMGAPGMRYATPNTTIMIHEVSGGTGGKIGDMTSDVAEAARLNALMFKLMAENLGKPADYFQKLMLEKGRVDWFLTAQEALGLGIIDKIGMPEFKVNVSVQTVLE